MVRMRPDEREAVRDLLNNEAKHVKTATEPVHYMIYGRNAETFDKTVPKNIQRVRKAVYRLATAFKNERSKNKNNRNNSEFPLSCQREEGFYAAENYIQVFKGDGADEVENDEMESDPSLDGVLPNGKIIISVRLLCSPPNYKAQNFHLDYGQDFTTVSFFFQNL